MTARPTAPPSPSTPAGQSLAAMPCYASSCGRVTMYLGDCRDIAPTLPVGSCDMLLADPPYGMGKEKDGVMNDNLYGKKLDSFLMDCWRACRPALKDNASAYIWGEAESLWRLWYLGGLADSEPLTMRNEVVWDKGHGQGMESDQHRQYATASERALFFMLGEQGFNNNADNYWQGWDSVVNYLRDEKEKTGWPISTFKRLAGHSEKSGCHWFDRSQWMMPTRDTYDAWRKAAEGVAFEREHDDLKREHDDLKREHDDLKRAFRESRAYFNNTHQSMTDVWEYPRVNGYDRHGHATPKPFPLMGRCVNTSCPPGGTVLDPFMGTAPTAIACIRTGRKFIGIDSDPTHYAAAVARITAELAQGDLFLSQHNVQAMAAADENLTRSRKTL